MMLLELLLFVILCCLQSCYCESSTILVTGGAGFIGYHTSLTLVESGFSVIVVDTFCDDDDNDNDEALTLKKSRAHLLVQKGVSVLQGSSSDVHIIEYIFDHYPGITGVVHCAGYTSISGNSYDPLKGAQNTVKSMVSLMNSLIKHKNVRLVYMSSAGVYSNKATPPLSSTESYIDPHDMYNTLMYSVEQVVNGYCHDYELTAVGLRLFTVYGPWDRPGDIVYDITDLMQSNEPVQIPYKDNIPLTRDFVYIGDVVQSIIGALKYNGRRGHNVFNVGNGVGIPLTTIVNLVKGELGKTDVEIIKSPLSSTIPISSYTDLTSLIMRYNKTSLKTGIKKFVQWWRKYKSNSYSSSFELDDTFDTVSFDESIKLRAHAFRERLADQREKYTEYAKAKNIPVAKFYRHKTFKFYPNREARGTLHRETNTTFANMKRVCDLMDDCVGFNTKGEIKTILQTSRPWTKGDGLYIADIDVCQAGLHNCFTSTKCVYEGPSLFSCQCDDNYILIDKECVEIYVAGKESITASDIKLRDRLAGIDISLYTLESDSQFYRHKGKESVGTNLLYVRDAQGDNRILEKACRATYHCVGFSTNGLLKRTLRRSKDWIITSDSDLYTSARFYKNREI